MRDATTRGNAHGVGPNPIFAWGRYTFKNAADPELIHGLGLSMKRVDVGKWLVTIDGGTRPRIFTPFIKTLAVTAAGTQAALPPGVAEPNVSAFDEAAGTFEITGDDTIDDVQISIVVFGAGP